MTSIEKSRRQPDAHMDSTGRVPWWQGTLTALNRTRKRLFGNSGDRIHRTRQKLKDKGAAVRAIRPDPSASWALVALRQRVLVGVVADNYRVYGRGRVRKIDR